ncbi:sulfatase family protein [Bythopirellula polymerisocia]|uniref:Arylsulfatase n=1 Tax=Bythopirellula polymerisocia TaxID=2528003 RepID=A0A5C6CHL3_9BACT|nr:arylsulfatase [Bythopirellula polymerisocia]TWU22706.1 Arylsulfatase [Bythopirellula polymerisocia]
MTMRFVYLPLVLVLHLASMTLEGIAETNSSPNIVLIYGDDIGYGDLGCYGAENIPTPNIDQLAKEGLRFTSGYCTSATCTPSRYSLLTGEYAWRKPGTGIAPPNGSALIEPGRVTLPSLLKQAGYRTGIVGKWHLGLGNPPKPNWSGTIKPGPLEIGFDYCFLMPTTNDRVPCVYVEDHHIVGLDPGDPVDVFDENPDGQSTGITDRDKLKMNWSHDHNNSIVNGISRIGFMVGGHDARWIDEEMADVFTTKATEYIQRNSDHPFFLFFSSQDIHVPRAPNARFVGSTPYGARGDAVVEFDACVGAIMQALQVAGVAENTLVIITSDNGPVLDDGYQDDAVTKLGEHKPAGPYRGGKYSNFEGGTRVPLIVYWPEKVDAGVSDAIISQVDFPATFAAVGGATIDLPEGSIPDSLDLSAALLGKSSTGRETLVEHAGSLSLRKGAWKYIKPSQGPALNRKTNTELGNSRMPQLYKLDEDPGETKNLASEFPAKVKELQKSLAEIRHSQPVHSTTPAPN